MTRTLLIQLSLLFCLTFTSAQPAFATIRQVPMEYQIVQEAIDACLPNDTVLVAEGEYVENLSITSCGITLASQYLFDPSPRWVESTVLRTPDPDSDIWRVISVASGIHAPVRIVGFTIRAGVVTRDDDTLGFGGGFSASNARVDLIGNVFESNFARRGGAVYLRQCEGIVHGNHFIGNLSPGGEGGGLSLLASNVLVDSNRFESNMAKWGGGVHASSSTAIFRGNMFFGDSTSGLPSMGGAVYLNNSGRTVLEGNHFEGCRSRQGGALCCEYGMDPLIVQENYFIDNQAWRTPGDGGALYVTDCLDSVLIDRNVFRDNWSIVEGGAIKVQTDAILTNNLFARNRAPRSPILYSEYSTHRIVLVLTNNTFVDNVYLPDPLERAAQIYVGMNTAMRLRRNDFLNNEGVALGQVIYTVYQEPVDADSNFWGSANGPFHESQNPEGSGDTVATDLDILPFLTISQNNQLYPSLEVQPYMVLFDTLWVGDSQTLPVSLYNTGGRTLQLYDMRVTGLRFHPILPFPTSIEPAESCLVFIRFEPEYDQASVGSLTFQTNDFFHLSVRVWLRGVGRELGSDEEGELPEEFSVRGLHPNPTNSEVTVTVALPRVDHLRFTLFNVLGQQVRVAETISDAGIRRYPFDLSNLSSGTYWLEVKPSRQVQVLKKVVLVK